MIEDACRTGGACIILPNDDVVEECAISVVESDALGHWRVIIACHVRQFDRWSDQRRVLSDKEYPTKLEAIIIAAQAQRSYQGLITVYDLPEKG